MTTVTTALEFTCPYRDINFRITNLHGIELAPYTTNSWYVNEWSVRNGKLYLGMRHAYENTNFPLWVPENELEEV